jgi:ABC-type transport system substrate-binding protein
MPRACSWLALLAALLAACGTGPVILTQSASAPAPTPSADIDALRFGVVGQVRDVNLWALFDQEGTGYGNDALMSAYWPRLYTLSIPDRQFIPQSAQGMPAPVALEGGEYIGMVKLRPDLAWTDGSPFTGADVAFTVNAALSFHLGYDWKAYYDFDALAGAEAVDTLTVRFHFKRAPDVALWQYGALQGPIAQRAYWEPRLSDAMKLLPPATLAAQVDEFGRGLAASQEQVDRQLATLSGNTPGTGAYQQADAALRRAREALNQSAVEFAGVQSEYENALSAARAALYAVPHEGEPTLGVWMPDGREGEAWVNAANPDFPFGRPGFALASYHFFAGELDAVTALEDNEVDALLAPDGLSREIVSDRIEARPPLVSAHNTASNARFIAISPASRALADPALRRVFFCAIARVPVRISMTTASIQPFVSSDNEFWHNPDLAGACSSLAAPAQVIEFLKASGYTWQREPTATEGAQGLILPEGTPFPVITLLAPAESIDPQRAEAARSIGQSAAGFGIPLSVKLVGAEDIRYAVYSSGQYDMAIIGYRLSAYPGYLCDWFGQGNPFGYSADSLTAACDGLRKTSDLGAARALLFEIQSTLVRDLPLIPLYEAPVLDAYRNLAYPFDSVPGGLSGVYGAPALAIPSH